MSGVSGGLRQWGLRHHFQYSSTTTHLRRHLYSSFCSSSTSSSFPRREKKQKVIVISGPTGAGKSRLAFELAKRINGEIITADSVQVYQGLDVGSAKPSPSERKEVPHHLLDMLHPAEEYSVGRFYDDARQATRDVLNKGHVPIITGGTGLYLRWFIYGKPDVPIASPNVTSQVYAELENYKYNGDWDAAVKLVLEAGDPNAPSLPTNNWYRLQRSLEIIKSSGSPPSAFQMPYDSYKEKLNLAATDDCQNMDGMQGGQLKELEYDFICFFLSGPRLNLYRSIDLRCEEMLSGSDGILAEAKWLLDIGLLPNSSPATRAIGYRQGMEYLLECRKQDGQSSAKEFFSFLFEFQKVSRNFAKRQMIWFRNDPIYHWLDASQPLEKLLDFIHDAYHDQSSTLTVPEWLWIKKDAPNRQEQNEYKTYMTKNSYFVKPEDCANILAWIRTEGNIAGTLPTSRCSTL
ncbi:tRNA dimethylallyltransferase 9-like [Chenopodium quinoa]|uniref:tRNA dimethylallyltransferase 9-like n=1 Tax=Chenopodium quinoa TaxID=63459 RepID=UPI000B79AAB5|nr:tRNA dimethylallyltransferase 9-like [Chenopodium quinoa]